MFYKLKEISYRHFEKNFILYLIVVMCLLIGISAGAITINVLDYNQKQELINFLDSFFKILNEKKVNSLLLLKHSLINNIQTAVTILILGIIVVGMPAIMIVVILRGFIIGFTVGFLFEQLGIKGLLFSVLSILPQNLFIIPGIVVISVNSIGFALRVIRNKINRNNRSNYFSGLVYYLITTSVIFIILFLGSLVEAYITPVFMKLILGYM